MVYVISACRSCHTRVHGCILFKIIFSKVLSIMLRNPHANVIRAGGKPIQQMLLKFFNIVEKFAKILNDWKMLATPIHKKNDKLNLENYRAISLLSIPGKQFNKLIMNKISDEINLKVNENRLALNLEEEQQMLYLFYTKSRRR